MSLTTDAFGECIVVDPDDETVPLGEALAEMADDGRFSHLDSIQNFI